ncbi:MAG: DegT/DnrJ/EryC1/StrS family aminotransferase [Acidimicrobiales bacterium]
MSDNWRVPFLDLAAMHVDLLPDLDALWRDVVTETAFIAGGRAEEFEQSWAEYCGASHAVGVANGTDSIELILRALGIGPEDEVIIPANTFIATAEAAVACGATPVYVDVDPDTLLVTAEQIAPAVNPRTAAVIPVHLYGQPCEMDDIMALAQSHGLAVVEDAAQAHGARWRGKRAGSIGTAASFSFYPGKNLGAFGDAGAVVTDDEELAARVRSLSNHGRADGEHVVHPLMGRNSRLDGLQAGVLHKKLALLDGWNAARQAAHKRYIARFAETDAITPVAEHPDAESVWHLNVVQVDQRDRVMDLMKSRGVDVRIHYPQPCHQHATVTDRPHLPVVEASTPRLLSLPMFPTITDEQIDIVCTTLEEVTSEVAASRVQ